MALQAGATVPQRADLGSDAVWMAGPALMPRSGRMLAFAVDPQHGRLATVVFTPDTTAAPAPTFRPLPFAATAGAAALAPAGEAAEVLLVGPTTAGSATPGLALAVLGVDPQPAPRQVVARGVVAMPGSSPAYRIDADGTGRAGLIAFADAGRRNLVIVDAVFPARGGTPGVSVAPLLQSARDAVAAVTAFGPGPDAGRAWAVQLDGGDVVTSRSAGRPARLPLRPASPMQLVVRPGATYLLVIDPAAGPTLLPLP